MYDRKKKRKAEKLLQKGKIDKAIKMYCEADLPTGAARLLERVGRHMEAARLYEKTESVRDAVRCYLKAGMEDAALKLYSDSYDSEISKEWANHIKALAQADKKTEAMGLSLRVCRLLSGGYLGENFNDWGDLMSYFRGPMRSNEDAQLWADMLMMSIDLDRRRMIIRNPGWEEAIAFLKIGNEQRAFEIFDLNIVSRTYENGDYRATFISGEEKYESEDVAELIKAVCSRYLADHDSVILKSLVDNFWKRMPHSLKKELIEYELRPQMITNNEIGYGTGDKELNHAPGISERGSEIWRALNLYESLEKKDIEIEQSIISYAEKIERYDQVLYIMEKFGRLREAIKYLGDTPAHIIWPDVNNPDEKSKQYREKLEYKLKRLQKSVSDKTEVLDKDELDIDKNINEEEKNIK